MDASPDPISEHSSRETRQTSGRDSLFSFEKWINRWPWLWVTCATSALIVLVEWQGDPQWAVASWQPDARWLVLIVALLLVVMAGMVVRTVTPPRRWAYLGTGALLTTTLIAAIETFSISSIDSHWQQWSEDERTVRTSRVASALNEASNILAQAGLAALSRAAADSTHGRQLQVNAPSTGKVESATALFHDGVMIAHAGQSRVPLTVGKVGVSFERTPFYTALVSRVEGTDRHDQAVTVELLASAPPADRFTTSLVQQLAGRDNASRVDLIPGGDAVPAGDPTMRQVNYGVSALAYIVARPRDRDEARLSALETARVRTSVLLLVAMVCVLAVGWRRPAGTFERVFVSGLMLAVLSRAPLATLSNVSDVFDVTNYFTSMGGPLTANVASLLLTAVTVLATLFLVLRTPRFLRSRKMAVLLVLMMAGAGPFVLRDLARGIGLPAAGASWQLWISWQLAIALAGASILLAGATGGQVALGTRRGLPAWMAASLAGAAAMFAPSLWIAPGTWPVWYPIVWIAAIVLLAFVRRSLALIVSAAIVAGSGAVTLTWGATMRARMHTAEDDVARLVTVDSTAAVFLGELAQSFSQDSNPVREPDALLRRYAASKLAEADYPARLARWIPGFAETPIVDVPLATIADSNGVEAHAAAVARSSGESAVRELSIGAITMLVASIPSADGGVITITVPPRSSLQPIDPFSSYTGMTGDKRAEPPYRLSVNTLTGSVDSTLQGTNVVVDRLTWRRRGNQMHGDALAQSGPASWQVHVEVELRAIDSLAPRGALLVLLDVLVVVLLWAASALADGGLLRWLAQRRASWVRSYRVRLSFTLLAFFLVPALTFAGWAWFRLRTDDRLAHELVVREALRIAALEPNRSAVITAARDVDAPLFLYRNGQLLTASDPVLELLSPIGHLLPAGIVDSSAVAIDDDAFEALTIPAGEQTALVGYRRVRLTRDSSAGVPSPLMFASVPLNQSGIVATPARGDEFALNARREDLAVLVLFAMAAGAMAALWMSGVASRSLSRPVGELREAALSLAAGGTTVRLDASPVAEFAPVFSAFVQMGDDLSSSRRALESAQQRTEAVLQNVASGVLALRADGSVLLANARARTMLGVALRATPETSLGTGVFQSTPLASQVAGFLQSDQAELAFDVTMRGRQLSARLTRLDGGAVLTLDDVTDVASAQRVLAWGEMARQIAHEIKNPLTPIRLGVQHLRRAFRDGRGDYADILETNVGRVLKEIDHLDEIARAFSRYGTAPAEREPAQAVSIDAVVRDVVALESLGEGGVKWVCSIPDDVPVTALDAWARNDELKEVLLNVLENARLADATQVEVVVERKPQHVEIRTVDNGSGISSDVLPRIFEPHFSTRTSGSGLGLAISRRLIESWGGAIRVSSAEGQGTTILIELRAVV